jgi:hypothetical protein
MDHVVALRLQHYTTSLKVASSRPGEVNKFYYFTLFFHRPSPWIYSSFNLKSVPKTESKIVAGSRARHKADNFTAICDPIV